MASKVMKSGLTRGISLTFVLTGLGTALFSDPSKAATSGICYFDTTGGTLPGVTCAGYSIQLGDKLFTVKTSPTFGIGKVAWETSPPLPTKPDLWQVNIDWFGAGLAGPIAGIFDYTVEIADSSSSIFNSIGLSSGGNYQVGPPDSVIVQTVFQGLSNSGPQIDTVTSTDGSANYSQFIGGKQIYVHNTWDIQNSDTIDNLSNYITQLDVPGPVPFAAIPIAMGWSRRLRQRIKKADRLS